jgi:hypothetical protein
MCVILDVVCVFEPRHVVCMIIGCMSSLQRIFTAGWDTCAACVCIALELRSSERIHGHKHVDHQCFGY